MNEVEFWRRMGLHNAANAATATARLSERERAAQDVLTHWRKIGLKFVTLADALQYLDECEV